MDASVAPPMDRSDIVCEQNRSPAEGEVGYPNSQELFSGSERRTDCETGSSGDENSLFQAEETCAPTRTGRLQRSKGQTLSSLSPINVISDNSSDLSQGIEEYLKNPFGKWGEQKKKENQKKEVFGHKQTVMEGYEKETKIFHSHGRERAPTAGSRNSVSFYTTQVSSTQAVFSIRAICLGWIFEPYKKS